MIQSFNKDKPYDQFVREQLAGDLLPEAPYETPEDREARLVATSLLSFGPKRHNSGGMEFQIVLLMIALYFLITGNASSNTR